MKQHYHVIVVGAGSSGIAAAVCASRSGCRTLLLEKNGFPGGLAVMGKISTICGLYRNSGKSSPEFLYDGFPMEFATRMMRADSLAGPVRMGRVVVLQTRHRVFETIADEYLASQTDLDTVYGAEALRLRMDVNRIRRIDFSADGRDQQVQADAVIDATGTAAVCEMAGVPVLLPDETEQGPAILFSAEDANGVFTNRTNLIRILMKIRRAVDSGDLPPGADSINFLPEIGEKIVTIKLNLGALVVREHGSNGKHFQDKAQEMKQQLIHFLQKNTDDFSHIRFSGRPGRVLHRAGKRARGMYLLTREDVLSAARFPDAVTRGCWPIEKYPASGGPIFSYLPEEASYDIPERCLRVPGVDNLFTAGRTISADDDAIASVRVIGCCLATGESAGNLAVRFVSQNGEAGNMNFNPSNMITGEI
ncbi:MAG: FAD-dependent oxidoreductase [Pseudomonadota bacterium]